MTHRKQGRQRFYEVLPERDGPAPRRDGPVLDRRAGPAHRRRTRTAPPHLHRLGETHMTAEKTTLLPVSPDEAFALVTEPERLRRWQTVSARVDLRAGGDYRWTVVPGHVASGSFREVVPGRRVVFGWGWEGSDDLAPDTSTVTLTLEPTEGGTLVRLVHEGLTAEQEVSHLEGWDHFFDRLERAAVTGDAGPDEWAAAPAQLDKLTSADATLAVCQHVLRGLTEADLDTPTPCSESTRAPASTTWSTRSPDSARWRAGPSRSTRQALPRCAWPTRRSRRWRPGTGAVSKGRSPVGPERNARRPGRQHPLARVPDPRLGLRRGHRPEGRRLRAGDGIRPSARAEQVIAPGSSRAARSPPRWRSDPTPTCSSASSPTPAVPRPEPTTDI